MNRKNGDEASHCDDALKSSKNSEEVGGKKKTAAAKASFAAEF